MIMFPSKINVYRKKITEKVQKLLLCTQKRVFVYVYYTAMYIGKILKTVQYGRSGVAGVKLMPGHV